MKGVLINDFIVEPRLFELLDESGLTIDDLKALASSKAFIMPAVLTEEMIDAASEADMGDPERFQIIYDALLAARPKAGEG